MRKKIFLILLLSFSTSTSIVYSIRITQLRPRNILLVTWDGVERKVFYELLDAGMLPFVSSLPHVINHTCLIGHVPIPEFSIATNTMPQHATMLSGYLPHIHGIYDNDAKDNPSGLKLPECFSMFFRIQVWFRYIYVQSRVGGYRIGGGTGKRITVGRLLGFDERGWYYDENGFDEFFVGDSIVEYPPKIPANYSVVEPFLEIAKNNTPFLYFFHFADPDRCGHQFGTSSPKYREAIVNCDSITQQIFERLAPSNPAIIVTSDHGRAYEYCHANSFNTFRLLTITENLYTCYMKVIAM